MIATNLSIERRPAISLIRRLKAPRAVTLPFVIHPTLLSFGAFLREQPVKAAYRKHPYVTPGSTPTVPYILASEQSDNIFLDALARAVLCHNHIRPQGHLHLSCGSGYIYHKGRRRNSVITARQTRFIHHATNIRPAISRTLPSREEYLNLVDTYRELYSTQAQWMEPTLPPASPTLFAAKPPNLMPLPPIMRPPSLMDDIALIPLAPVTLPAPIEDNLLPNRPTVVPDTQLEVSKAFSNRQTESPRPDVKHLSRVLNDSECTHHEAYSAYSAIPSPGVSYLSPPLIRLLFRRLSTIQKKDRDSALRYLAVVDDMKSIDCPMIDGEWNSAIAFCGQCFSHVRPAEVENALLTWKTMEGEANVRSGSVTFNILFDIAAKAGKFVLAGMILKEMEARGLGYNRYFRVGNIYFNGLKGDGDSVRQAYRELVEAGEIVDTVVMNCVIAALISAGELASAENVYERMKRMLTEHTGRSFPTRTWQETRDLGRVFDRWAQSNRRYQHKSEYARRNHLKDRISIVPDAHTYAIFIEHHAWHTGDLYRISALLNEMQSLGVAMQGRIFLKLFKGFAKHGGGPYTLWTPSRLQSVWKSLLDILDEGSADVSLGKWLVVWAVKAFAQCAGREWALHIWEEMTSRWTGTEADLRSARARLKNELGF